MKTISPPKQIPAGKKKYVQMLCMISEGLQQRNQDNFEGDCRQGKKVRGEIRILEKFKNY